MVKTIVNRRQQLGCHHSELYLGRSKKSNNQGIKVKVKRTLIYYFLSRKKRRQALLEIFLNPEYWCAGVSNPHLKINVPLFCCSLFFKSQVRINKMPNIVTYYKQRYNFNRIYKYERSKCLI